MVDVEWVETAAKVFCEHQLTDYRIAKNRAGDLLRRRSGSAQPDNAAVEKAIIGYQQLFGGDAYRQHLTLMRETALKAMRWLADFEPRLVGGGVSGAVTTAHRVQLHVFAESSETIDRFFIEQGVDFEPGDRRYRTLRGAIHTVPLLKFEAGAIGVDVAAFDVDDLRQAPVSPVTGRATKRLDVARVEALLNSSA